MKINIEIPDNSEVKILVDGKEWPTEAAGVLWTPKDGETYFVLDAHSNVEDYEYVEDYEWRDEKLDRTWLAAGNIFPTREHAEAAKRHREAQSIVDRYFYAKGVDTRWKEGVDQWCVYLDAGELKVCDYVNICYASPFYVESEAIANQAIADIPDALRTVLLRGWV